MFGWEFPPFNSGGLGVACQGLAGGLASLGAQITFVLPKKLAGDYRGICEFVFADEQKEYRQLAETIAIDSPLSPYLSRASYSTALGGYEKIADSGIWRKDLVGEVMRYAELAAGIAKNRDFDVIHCHDWLSLPAGLAAKKASGKPLVFHVHATEYDRVGENGLNRDICLVEREGLRQADAVIAVSDYTKNLIIDRYGVNPDKIISVPNAVNHDEFLAGNAAEFENLKKSGKKIALFVGRLTFQKGPDYFLAAAKKAAAADPDLMFVFSGSGDMERWLIEESARLEIADKVIFAGFSRGDDLKRLYKMADIYVMPSVSEPFGLTSLEALASGAPILVSRQSGVARMVSHCLKVDFWDVDQIAAKIVAAARYSELRQTLRDNGLAEVKKFNWIDSARKCFGVYQKVITS